MDKANTSFRTDSYYPIKPESTDPAAKAGLKEDSVSPDSEVAAKAQQTKDAVKPDPKSLETLEAAAGLKSVAIVIGMSVGVASAILTFPVSMLLLLVLPKKAPVEGHVDPAQPPEPASKKKTEEGDEVDASSGKAKSAELEQALLQSTTSNEGKEPNPDQALSGKPTRVRDMPKFSDHAAELLDEAQKQAFEKEILNDSNRATVEMPVDKGQPDY